MADPTLVISIDRTSLSLSPLLLSGSNDGSTLGITGYTEPAKQTQVHYAPSSRFVHGETPLSWKYQQAVLGFDAFTDLASTEAAHRTAIASLGAAITQWSFTVTVTVDGAPSETWTCQPGSLVPLNPRDYVDLKYHNAAWSVSLPCHPVPAIGA